MTVAPSTPDDEPTRTESLDSVLVEFTDAELDVGPRPIRDAVFRRLPGWLREALETRGRVARPANGSGALADCLLEQARVLVALRRLPDAAAKVAEAERLYREAATPAGVADCLHLAAKIHEELGEPDKAYEYLRKEEEIRRRLAA